MKKTIVYPSDHLATLKNVRNWYRKNRKVIEKSSGIEMAAWQYFQYALELQAHQHLFYEGAQIFVKRL